MKKLGIIVLLIIAISSCATADELKSSPTTLNIDGSQFTLDAVAWRDFMPPTEPNGKPMSSKVQLNLISGPDILSNIHFVRQYVIYGNEIWAADIYFIGVNSNFVEGTSSGGPKWGPDVNVDIVLEFTYNNNTYKILCPNQPIERVE